MRRLLPILFLLISISCTDTSPTEKIIRKHHRAVGKTKKINNLITYANCQGPEGNYTTYTSSSFTDDYVLFKQDYEYRNNPFYAVIYQKDTGYGLDTALSSQGPLSDPVIAVLKAHEFHELMMQVDLRYSGMELIGDTIFFDQPCAQIRASDHLGLPVRLYFNKKTNLLEGMSQSNPYKRGEIISVHFFDWEKVDGLKVFKKLEIQQGKVDRYLFEFENIEWNVSDFNKLSVE